MFFSCKKNCKFARIIYLRIRMRYYGLIVVAVMSLWLSACSKETSDIDDQRTTLENYISQKALENVDYLGGVYRYVINRDRNGYETALQAEPGNTVVFNYSVYVFSKGPGTLIYTNNPDVQNEQEGLDPAYWPKEPLKVVLGQTPLISGLEKGLNGVRQGDTLQLYMSSDMGYGDNPMGTIKANTPLVWSLGIKEVIK